MYVNAFVLGILATLFVEMATVIGMNFIYAIVNYRRSKNKKRRKNANNF